VKRVPVTWTAEGEFEDIRYELSGDGIAKITIDRAEVRNAFRPQTIVEISQALERAREDTSVGVIVLTARARSPSARGRPAGARRHGLRDPARVGRLGRFHVTDLHVQIRRLPSPSWRWWPGYAVGGGHVLHLVCDLTIAGRQRPLRADRAQVGSFDGGYGAALLSSMVGPKKAKEIWFLCRQYDAAQALEMGLVNTVVPLDALEAETGAVVPRDARALPLLAPAAEGQLPRGGRRVHAASSSSRTTRTSCSTPPRRPGRGREAYKAKRKPDFSQFPKRP
jgi:naphthoate synthase